MSLLLIAGCAAGLAAVSGFVAARRARVLVDGTKGAPEALPAPVATAAPEEEELGVSLKLGHVVALVGAGAVAGQSEERWLSGGLVLSEGDSVAAVIFSAPEGIAQGMVVAFPAPRSEILWLSPVEVELGSDLPTTIEHQGLVLQRKRRLGVSLRRVGRDAPSLGKQGVYAEYASTGAETLVALLGESGAIQLWGRRLTSAEYDPMGSGVSR